MTSFHAKKCARGTLNIVTRSFNKTKMDWKASIDMPAAVRFEPVEGAVFEVGSFSKQRFRRPRR